MSVLNYVLSFTLPLAALALAVIVGIKAMKRTLNAKCAFCRHFITLGVSLVVCFCCVMAVSAATPEEDTTVDATVTTSTTAATETEKTNNGAGIAAGLGFVGAGLSIGLAAVGGGIALSASAPAAIGAVAEDPKSFGKSMIFVALGEAVAIYGFIIAFLVILKLPTIGAM